MRRNRKRTNTRSGQNNETASPYNLGMTLDASTLWPLWIGGQLVTTSLQRSVRSPYHDVPAGIVCDADPTAAAAAVEAAARAAATMRTLSRHERAAILRRAAALLLDRKQHFALGISAESAKPLRESLVEVDRGVATLEASAMEALHITGEMVPMDTVPAGDGYMGFTIREPLGVVAAITPFNFPLNLALHKLAPAIAAGNSIVHKPASTTPITALRLAALFHEAGLPPGGLNTVPGAGSVVGEIFATHPAVNALTFTGSAEVGLSLRQRAGLKRVTLELGNNSAVIVMPDAPVEDSARRCALAAYTHSGQVCISLQRVFVHQEIFECFVQAFTSVTASLRQGPPEDPETQISCLISDVEAARVHSWILEADAPIRTGGSPPDGPRLTPTVLTHVSASASLMLQEAFGPVACINPIASLEEGIKAVNDSRYGLQTGIFTNHAPSAWQAAHEIHSGAVLINETPQFRLDHMPYGGVKDSGIGREGPRYAIQELTEPKLIVWRR